MKNLRLARDVAREALRCQSRLSGGLETFVKSDKDS